MKKVLACVFLVIVLFSNFAWSAANQVAPIFLVTPHYASVMMSAADTDRDGSGDSLYTLFTAGANGSRIDGVQFISSQASAAANSAMVCRIYVTDASGNNPMLRGEVVLPAVTASNTAVGAVATYSFVNGLILEAGRVVKVTQSLYAGVQDKLCASAIGGGDY
jgi:hypothetical protein